jgi:uncharacterized Zn finger protein
MNFRVDLGRTLARAGAIIHLESGNGRIHGIVVDDEAYDVVAVIEPMDSERLLRLSAACTVEIGSTVDLLAGKISENLMNQLASDADGIFPKPSEIKFRCNCLDYADMCPHGAAALYGFGVIGEVQPELFFRLRGVEPEDLVGRIGSLLTGSTEFEGCSPQLQCEDLADLFDIDLAGEADWCDGLKLRPETSGQN